MGKTRRAFTVSEKLKVVDWHLANGAVVKKTAREFDLNPKHVRDWLASHSVLLQNDFGSTRNKLRLYSGNRAAWPQLDQDVFHYFTARRNASAKISDDDLKEYALHRAKELELSTFTASNGWLRRWKLRHGVRVRRGAKRTLPVEKEEQLTAFFDAVQALRAEHRYGDGSMLIMHQLTVSFTSDAALCESDCQSGRLPDSRSPSSGAPSSGPHTHSYAFTVSLVASGDGSKYSAAIVFKTRQPLSVPTVTPSPVARGGSRDDRAHDGHASMHGIQHLRPRSNIRVYSSDSGGLTPSILEDIIDNLSQHSLNDSSHPYPTTANVASSGVALASSVAMAAHTSSASSSNSNSSSSSSSEHCAYIAASSMATAAVSAMEFRSRQLLIVDSSRDHTTVSCRRAANRGHFDMVVIPDGCYSVLDNTIHTVVLKPFKQALARHWEGAVQGKQPVQPAPLPSQPRHGAAESPGLVSPSSLHMPAPFSANPPVAVSPAIGNVGNPGNIGNPGNVGITASITTGRHGLYRAAEPSLSSATVATTAYQVGLSSVHHTPASSLSNIMSGELPTETMQPSAVNLATRASSDSSSSHSSLVGHHSNEDEDSDSDSDTSVTSTAAQVDAEDLDVDDELQSRRVRTRGGRGASGSGGGGGGAAACSMRRPSRQPDASFCHQSTSAGRRSNQPVSAPHYPPHTTFVTTMPHSESPWQQRVVTSPLSPMLASSHAARRCGGSTAAVSTCSPYQCAEVPPSGYGAVTLQSRHGQHQLPVTTCVQLTLAASARQSDSRPLSSGQYLAHSVESILHGERHGTAAMRATDFATQHNAGNVMVLIPSQHMPILVSPTTSAMKGMPAEHQQMMTSPAGSRTAGVDSGGSEPRASQALSMQLVCDIVANAWNDVSAEHIRSAFIGCGLTGTRTAAMNSDMMSRSAPATPHTQSSTALSGLPSPNELSARDMRTSPLLSARAVQYGQHAHIAHTPASAGHAVFHAAHSALCASGPTPVSGVASATAAGAAGFDTMRSKHFTLSFSSDLLDEAVMSPWA